MTINIFNKTTVSCEESLDPGPEARAGLHQGVPGKEPHQPLHLLDQITGFVARLCIEPLFRDATYKIVKRVAVRQAGKPDLLHPHLPKVLLLLAWTGLLSCWKINANRFFWDSHWLEIWSNHFYPSMGPNGGSMAMDSGGRQSLV